MTSPQQQNQKQPLQVDVRHVVDVEAEQYTTMIARLVRDLSVVQVALRDRDAYVEELEARVQALGGRSAVPGRPPMPMPRPPSAAHQTAEATATASTPGE